MTGRYEMLVEQNADVPMRDGAILCANVYRPNADGRFPVLMTFGPYGKDVPLREFMQEAWDRLNQTYAEILAASSCKHLVFERRWQAVRHSALEAYRAGRDAAPLLGVYWEDLWERPLDDVRAAYNVRSLDRSRFGN